MYKVIIVDDNSYICRGLRDTVDWSAYDMNVVGTYDCAEEVIGSLSKNIIDIAFVDIQLPGMSGLQLSQHLRMYNPNIIIIIISAYSEFSFTQKCIEIGICRYLLKPIDSDELSELLSQIHENLRTDMQQKEKQHKNELEVSELQSVIVDEYLSTLSEHLNETNESAVKDIIVKLNAVASSSPAIFWKSITPFLNNSDLKYFMKEGYPIDTALMTRSLLDKFRQDKGSGTHYTMERARRYIEDHYTNNISLESLAEMYSFTPSYFSTCFKQAVGKTFSEFLIEKRMNAARSILKKGHTAKQAAYMVGYQNYKSFYKMYKRTFGCAPVEDKDKKYET